MYIYIHTHTYIQGMGLILEITDLFHSLIFAQKYVRNPFSNIYLISVAITTLSLCISQVSPLDHQLVYLYNTFLKALNDKKDVRMVFCDQSKAFDRVWHQGLLYKLECIGITGDL